LGLVWPLAVRGQLGRVVDGHDEIVVVSARRLYPPLVVAGGTASNVGTAAAPPPWRDLPRGARFERSRTVE
jgi:hypothetical protein